MTTLSPISPTLSPILSPLNSQILASNCNKFNPPFISYSNKSKRNENSISFRRGFNLALKFKKDSNKYVNYSSNIDFNISKILPFLWLGSFENANNPKEIYKKRTFDKSFSLIINVTQEPKLGGCPNTFKDDGIRYFRIPISDTLVNIHEYFDIFYDIIEKERINNNNVLVHCEKGISRSPTLVISYLMRHLKISFEKALDFVRKERPTVSPNIYFTKQLTELESKL